MMSAKHATIAVTSMLFLAAAPISNALAQSGHRIGGSTSHPAGNPSRHAPPQKALAGANTTDGATTGSSGPQKSSHGPPKPEASMCNSFKGAVHQDCLDTVLRSAGPQNSNKNSAQKSNGG
jgi:hypothetical protein